MPNPLFLKFSSPINIPKTALLLILSNFSKLTVPISLSLLIEIMLNSLFSEFCVAFSSHSFSVFNVVICPKKKKKKKAAQNRPLDIWDEGVDTETQVAELHKKGLSIMEIANKLGIGVGEAKVMIDQINETKTTENSDETGRQ